MKFLSQLFETQGIDSTYKAFKDARFKLVLIYLIIITVVILLFSYLVILQVTKKEWSRSLPEDSEILLNSAEAQAIAENEKPGVSIIDSKYELAERTVVYEFNFEDGDELYVDVLNGSISREGRDYEENIIQLLTNETDEIIWWYALIVFLLASFGSILVANTTLNPIATSIRKQKRFVSDAAHEIRNPLAALQTTLESYTRDNNPSKQLNQLVAKDMLHEVKRLIDTSEALLLFERNEKSKNVSDYSVSDTLQEAVQRLEPLMEKKNIVLKSDINDAALRIDRQDLEMILYNLIHNAIKFSDQNSEILVNWSGTDLIVSDSGIGISAEHIPHIFDRFYKTDESRSFETNSSGLGLALVAEIVHSYKGEIVVDSTEGEGTNFIITL